MGPVAFLEAYTVVIDVPYPLWIPLHVLRLKRKKLFSVHNSLPSFHLYLSFSLAAFFFFFRCKIHKTTTIASERIFLKRLGHVLTKPKLNQKNGKLLIKTWVNKWEKLYSWFYPSLMLFPSDHSFSSLFPCLCWNDWSPFYFSHDGEAGINV